MPEKGADGGQTTRDRRGRESAPPAPELRDPVREHASVDVVQDQTTSVEPGGERAKVASVRTLRRLGEPPVLEEALDRGLRVHGAVFAVRDVTPAALSPSRARGGAAAWCSEPSRRP